MIKKELLSIGETSRLLGVSIQTLRRWDSNGTLKSFRPTPGGNRFYRKGDIDLFMKDLSALGWQWAVSPSPFEPAGEFYCATSDVFSVRLARLENSLEKMDDLKVHYSLIVSMVAEIGENSYAHNLGNWPDILGVFFAYDLMKRQIVLADRGRGILETLRNVRPELNSHQEALKVAFTEIISGRAPENRGRGLKMVRENILQNAIKNPDNLIKLIFRTGDAQLDLSDEREDLNITECEVFHGCYTVLKF